MSDRPERCPFIHPVEGVRCEKYDHRPDSEHIVKGYWTGGDALRWSYPTKESRE